MNNEWLTERQVNDDVRTRELSGNVALFRAREIRRGCTPRIRVDRAGVAAIHVRRDSPDGYVVSVSRPEPDLDELGRALHREPTYRRRKKKKKCPALVFREEVNGVAGSLPRTIRRHCC